MDRIIGRVSTSVARLLDLVRVIGNGAVHVDDDPHEIVVLVLDDEEGAELVELLLDTSNYLVEELIARPKETQRLWDRLPEKTRLKRLPATSDD